jgi:hypothetical protein
LYLHIGVKTCIGQMAQLTFLRHENGKRKTLGSV